MACSSASGVACTSAPSRSGAANAVPYPTTSASTVARAGGRRAGALEREDRGAFAEAGPPSPLEPEPRARSRWKARNSASLIASAPPDEQRVGAPLIEQHVRARDRVERAAVAVAHAHVAGAEVLPDAHVPGRAVRDGEREARRVDVPRVLEHRDAIELGDRLERTVRVRDDDARALRPGRAEASPGSVALEPRVVQREARGDHEELREPIEAAQSLVAEVPGGVEVGNLGHRARCASVGEESNVSTGAPGARAAPSP